MLSCTRLAASGSDTLSHCRRASILTAIYTTLRPHPSGDREPSTDDASFAEVGATVGSEILDRSADGAYVGTEYSRRGPRRLYVLGDGS